MPGERSSAGDPARTLELLWRHAAPAAEGAPRRPGRRPRLTVDAVVAQAIAVADAEGLEAVTMRRLAGDLEVTPMALYRYVPGRAELVDLMLDELYRALPLAPWPDDAGWRERVRAVADANLALYAAHPWAARVSTVRPPLGPGLLAKYEHELAAFDGTGLADVDVDAALTFVLAFVRAAALGAAEARSGEGDDAAWWEAAGPLLARVVDADAYPRAARIGTAAGEAQGAAYEPGRAYAFGIERVLDGLAPLVRGG